MKHREKNKIIREQLAVSLKPFSKLTKINRPHTGWIRALRTALGMSMATLAERLGVHKSRVSKIEQDEVAGNLTIKTMQKVADGLDCVFVYGFVPRSSLDDTINQQAFLKASKELNKLMHTMSLEAQDLPNNERQKLLKQMINQILESGSLWK
jgi:predicted DNA-binding mobile mystery protein A